MKKTIILMAAAAALVSCNKAGDAELPYNGSPHVELSFADPASRAFGAGATETWEKSLSSATLLVYDNASKLLFQKALTAAEITSLQTTPLPIVLPGTKVGSNCEFIVVANRAVSPSASVKTLTDTDIASYNGTFAQVTAGALHAGGFVMSGSTTQAIAAGTTSVSILLKRLAAKVEVKTAVSPSFTSKYTGTLTIDQATISRSAESSYLLPGAAASAAAYSFSHTQASASGQNLFYIYENPTKAEGGRVLLTIAATYDADGSAATTGDRSAVKYEVELTGSASGQILRNGAYLVNVTVNGLTGSDVGISVSVTNWATLVTQNINVG